MANNLIISQHGEVAGRLSVEIERIAGSLTSDKFNREVGLVDSNGMTSCHNYVGDEPENFITCRLTIKSATGIPPSLSQFVFCQYTFYILTTVVTLY